MVSYRREGENVFVRINVHGEEREFALSENQKANIKADIKKVLDEVVANNQTIEDNNAKVEELEVQIEDLKEDNGACEEENEELMSKLASYRGAFESEINEMIPVEEEVSEE